MHSSFGRPTRPLIALWLLLLATGQCVFAGKEFLAGAQEQTVSGQLVVGLEPGADIAQILAALAPQARASLVSGPRHTYLLKLPPGIQAAVSHLLASHPMVKYVEPNRIRHTTVLPPNDTNLYQQWNLTTVQAPQAWNYFPDYYLTAATAGSNRVSVAILDTGVDCTHPDFMNAGGTSTNSANGGQLLWASSEALAATTISSPACPWEDDNGHGTHTAGILAAATNNAIGVASLGYLLQLIVIKTNNASGEATDVTVAQGIDAAVNAGAQVISMSLGGDGYSQNLQSAMDYAWEHNVLVVAAAGNDGNTNLEYPGGGNHVLGVAATTNTNAAASFSTFGNWVKIAAPGVNVYSTLPTYGSGDGANYGFLSGTSMATPHVAALGGLLVAANPGISVAALAQRIQQTAQSPFTGWNEYIGYGVINAGAALGGIAGPFTQGSFTGQVIDNNGNALSGAVVTAGGQSYTTINDPNTGDTDGLFRIPNLNPGSYAISVAASGFSTVNIQGTVVAGADTMLTIQMGVSYGEFTGAVTHNGVAVAGAVVEAVSGGLIQGTAITNSSGTYTLYIQPGTYTLTASAPNYINTTSASQTLTANGTVTVNLALSALGNIIGTVTDVNGLPIANAHIDFTNSSFTGGAVTGANGTYATYGLPAGTYNVTASASGFTNVSVTGVSVTNNVSTVINPQFSTGIALSSGLLGYWPLNDDTGTVAHDQSGNGYNATLQNTTWVPGLFNYAVNFNGSSASTPSIPFTNTFSISAWVNAAVTTQNAWAGIAESESTNGAYWLSLGVDSTGTQYKFIVNNATSSTGTCGYTYGCAQGGTVSTGWHMVTGTYDGTTALLYVDAVPVASDTALAPANATVPLQMGASWTTSEGWNGALDAMRLYNRALTAEEVSSIFTQATTLSLTKTAGAATVTAGSPVGFTLAVKNTGSGTATLAALSDPLPTGTAIAWSISPAYSGPGTCSIASGTLTCNFGSLSAGVTATVQVASATTIASCGTYSNTASASASNASTVQGSATSTVSCGQAQTIAFGALSNKAYGTPPFTVSATASSGLTVSFNSQTASVCTVSGSTVTLVAIGTCTIQATQAGNATYSAATPVNQSFTVTPAGQTITFAALSNKVFGTAPFTVSATASSGLTVSFNSQTTSICTVSGSTVTLVAGGTCTVQATQAGNANYSAATPVNQSFTVTPESQTITFGTLSNTVLGSAPFTVSATATSGLTVSFNSQTTPVCTVSGSTVTLVVTGTCTIQATQAGNASYSAASPVNQSFSVTSKSQTITFGTLSNKVFGAAPFTVSATATSGLAVSFNSQTTASCTVAGSTVTLVTVGTCTIQATQAGNTTWAAATPVNQSFTVTQGSQTITFGTLLNKALGTAPFTVSATASSGLTVSFNSQTTAVCTVSGSTVTLVTTGTCTIQATQAGNGNWTAATPVSQSFTVTGALVTLSAGSLSFPNTIVGKPSAVQTVTLQNPGNAALTIASIQPTGSDGGSYQYSADATHPCPISPSTLAAGGTCTLDVAFVPVSAGAHNNAQLTVTDNAGNVAGAKQTISLTGTGIVLSSIAISAGNTSIPFNTSEQFTATGTYSDTSTANISSQVTWASSATNVATLNTSGLLSALTAGQSNITATLSGVTSNTFQLTVTSQTPASIAVSAGSGQNTALAQPFPSPLQALVKDINSSPVPNITVTFTAPASGASGTFANGLATYSTMTNSSGIATAITFSANITTGNYAVSASVTGVATPASFFLTNVKAPTLTITASPVGTFVQGQSGAYTVTVGNAATGATTTGTVTVTETAPAGLTVTAMSGGATWSCSSGSCTTNSILVAGSSYPPITVTLSVGYGTPATVNNQVKATGGGSAAATAMTPTNIISACNITLSGNVSIADAQRIVNEALGVSPATNDLNNDGSVNVTDLQIVIGAVLGMGCSAT